MVSRQYKWAEKRNEEGRCRVCGKPLVSKLYCKEHTLKMRERSRNKYRLKNGIPLNKPLLKVGRPKIL